ncbi:MAG: lipocalin family protein [Arenibacter algicola]
MKKLTVIIFSILFSISCSKENQSEIDKMEGTIIGKWYYDYYIKDGERYVLDQTFENEGCASIKEWYVEFTDSGEFVQFFVNSCMEDSETSRYTLKDNELSFLRDDGSSYAIADIIKLTNKELVFTRIDEGSKYEQHFKR